MLLRYRDLTSMICDWICGWSWDLKDPALWIKLDEQNRFAALSLKIGRSIKWDGEKEIIIGDPEANRLLHRKYRKPWVYPKV
jgi:hypothetical protein